MYYLVSPEEKAIDMFNSALKQCVYLSAEMQKNEAKAMVLTQLAHIKQVFYNMQLFDKTPPRFFYKTLNYYTKIEETINKF